MPSRTLAKARAPQQETQAPPQQDPQEPQAPQAPQAQRQRQAPQARGQRHEPRASVVLHEPSHVHLIARLVVGAWVAWGVSSQELPPRPPHR